jgi:glycogen debranching enzyme
MPHELRCGELAHFKKIPHTPYYGTADATPLYLIVLHEAWKWMGDDSLLREYREVALRCLEWIDQYGDLDGNRLPELYAGIELQPGMFPVQYPEANVPQAWAAGSVFHLLQAILGLQADAPNNRLYVDPDLPEWLPEITLHHLAVSNARIDLRFWRESERTRWEAFVQAGDINLQQQSWQPFTHSTDAKIAF